MEVPDPPVTALQGSIGCNMFSFSSDQLCELENIYCRGQSQEDDAAMVLILALLEASPEGFSDLPAHVIKASWHDSRTDDLDLLRVLLTLHSFHIRHQRSQQAPDSGHALRGSPSVHALKVS